MTKFRDELHNVVTEEWKKIQGGNFFKYIEKNGFDRELYIKTMAQIYHYTKNNSINQASATFFADHKKVGLLRFALKHALEELGHENMIVKDLSSIGVTDEDIFSQPPLPATEALNGYLYSVAIREGIIPRLGYSFWAESCYDFIQPLLESARNTLDLSDEQMTFFIAHSVIDEGHAEEVNKVIDRWATSDSDEASIMQVAKTTLYLTGQILESVVSEI